MAHNPGRCSNGSRRIYTARHCAMTCRNRRVAAELAAGGAIGSAMKSEILAPSKMQDVAGIIDNALLVRFKFTARPGNPAMIQREAVKRMFKSFPRSASNSPRRAQPSSCTHPRLRQKDRRRTLHPSRQRVKRLRLRGRQPEDSCLRRPKRTGLWLWFLWEARHSACARMPGR